MNNSARWLVCGLLLVSACSDDDDDERDGGSHAGSGGSNAGNHDSGARAGSGGKAGSTASGGAGSSGKGGSGGARAGSGGADSGNSMAMDSGRNEDSGTDAGSTMMAATVCKAPVVAAQSGNECPTGAPPALKLTRLKTDLSYPIFVTQPPHDDSRLFVVQRNGQILLLDPNDGTVLGEFMTVPNVADAGGDGGEMGLLGMAFHPDYPADPRFFVNYNTDDTERLSVIASFEVMADDPDRGDPTTGVPLVTYVQPEGNHKGGMVAFGPDGCMFVAAGDGGGSNDQHGDTGNGQNLETPLGKILRIDVDNPTERPAGNLEGTSVPHIWDYGVRNPWRFSFDRMTGDLYIGDVGQDNYEEVDVEPKGDGNKNYGWKVMEGTHCRPGGDASCDMNGLTLPISEYPHGNGDDCVVGGYVYRGSAIPELRGWYLYGDNGGGDGDPVNDTNATGRRVRALVWDGTHSCQATPPVVSQLNNFDIATDITSFGEDSHGELYITTLHSLIRIDKM